MRTILRICGMKMKGNNWDYGTCTEESPDEVTVQCCSCSVLYEPVGDIDVDVIFVHGMFGNSSFTWRTADEPVSGYHFYQHKKSSDFQPQNQLKEDEIRRFFTDKTDVVSNEKVECWPRDWLPKDFPRARVLGLDYTQDPDTVYFKCRKRDKRKWSRLGPRATEMMDILLTKGVGERPIIWCGHSKGGIYIKQIIINAYEAGEMRIVEQTRGLMMMSVPHRGVNLPVYEDCFLRVSREVKELVDTEAMVKLHQKFMKLYEQYFPFAQMINTVETKYKRIGIVRIKTTSFSSADIGFGPYIGLDVDHGETCKAFSRNCIVYKTLLILMKKPIS